MKHAWILLSLLLLMWLILGAAMFVPQAENALGYPHEDLKPMRQGGDGIDRHGRLLWIGWLLGMVQHLFFVGCICFGARRGDRLSKLTIPLLVGVLLELAVVSALFLSYHRYLHETSVTFLGPFPTPTAIMLFGTWAVPFWYVVLYVVTFPRHVWTPDDQKRFEEIVRARKSSVENQV